MQTVTRKLITGTLLSLSAVVMLLLFSATQVMAAGGARTTGGSQTTASDSGWSGGTGVISSADWIIWPGDHAVTVDSNVTLTSTDGGQTGDSLIVGARAGTIILQTTKDININIVGLVTGI